MFPKGRKEENLAAWLHFYASSVALKMVRAVNCSLKLQIQSLKRVDDVFACVEMRNTDGKRGSEESRLRESFARKSSQFVFFFCYLKLSAIYEASSSPISTLSRIHLRRGKGATFGIRRKCGASRHCFRLPPL